MMINGFNIDFGEMDMELNVIVVDNSVDLKERLTRILSSMDRTGQLRRCRSCYAVYRRTPSGSSLF